MCTMEVVIKIHRANTNRKRVGEWVLFEREKGGRRERRREGRGGMRSSRGGSAGFS